MITLRNMPEQFAGVSAWTGKDISLKPDKWLYLLTDEDIQDLEHAANHFVSLNCDIGSIDKHSFPLKHFDKHLEKLKQTLLSGIGFGVIRGLPDNNYSQSDIATIFCGIGVYLGRARSQNAQGHILGHVRDIGADANDPNSRIYQTCERQSFHTDSADVVGLICIKKAKKGGVSLLVSSESIYNRMRKECPELLAKLFDPIATDRRGEVPEGQKPFLTIPVFSWYGGCLTVFYQRQYIDSAQRFKEAMRLTPEHIEALDRFDALANDPSLHFSMQLEPGDMQFVYNHSQLHDRTGFLDWPAKSERRHLMRLWLSLANDRNLPACFAQRYGSLEVGNRGGIHTNLTTLHAPFD